MEESEDQPIESYTLEELEYELNQNGIRYMQNKIDHTEYKVTHDMLKAALEVKRLERAKEEAEAIYRLLYKNNVIDYKDMQGAIVCISETADIKDPIFPKFKIVENED